MKRNLTHILIYFFFVAAIAVLFSSCLTKKRASKQLTKIHKEYPELFQRDTLILHDTTYINAVRADTVLINAHITDTVTIQKERLTMRYFYSNDTVFLSGTCKDSVVIREIHVPTEKAIITNSGLPKWVWPVIIAMAAFIVLLLLFRR